MTDYLMHPDLTAQEATPDEWSPPPMTQDEWTVPPATPEQWSPPPMTRNPWELQQDQWELQQASQWISPAAPQAQWGPPGPPVQGPVFVYDKSPNRWRKTFAVGAVIALVVGAATAAIVVTGTSNGPVGFNDPAKLADDISATMNLKAIDLDYDFAVTSVDCIKNQGREFVCHVEFSTGEASTLSVTVS